MFSKRGNWNQGTWNCREGGPTLHSPSTGATLVSLRYLKEFLEAGLRGCSVGGNRWTDQVGRCSFWDRHWILLRVTSGVWAEEWLHMTMYFLNVFLFICMCCVFVAACGIYFPDQGSDLSPLHWEHWVLATGLPRKPMSVFLQDHGSVFTQDSITKDLKRLECLRL